MSRKYVPYYIRIQVYEKYNGHCAYCGKEIEYKDMQIDHKLPVRCSYEDKVNEFENLMPSCRRCNHYKRSNLLNNYRWLLKTITKRLMKNYLFKVALDYGIIEIKEWDGRFYFEKID